MLDLPVRFACVIRITEQLYRAKNYETISPAAAAATNEDTI